MAQTREGAIISAAKKSGISAVEYVRRSNAGRKWCVLCRKWHQRKDFGKDKTRWDGLFPSCFTSRSEFSRSRYIPRPRPRPGRRFVPPRDGDKKQARFRINYFVGLGLIPLPNSIPCVDCGHVWCPGSRRHEYDHHLGYAAEHHECVEAVCSICHFKREAARGNQKRIRGSTGRYASGQGN